MHARSSLHPQVRSPNESANGLKTKSAGQGDPCVSVGDGARNRSRLGRRVDE